jgi:uncharacterized membrane protein
MGRHTALLILATFLASGVEMVEALTIVLAVGATRGWRHSLLGAAAGTVALGVAVGILGPALIRIPIGDLRLLVGALLLVFGLQWLKKAILRASGFVALHDEDDAYRRQVEAAHQSRAPGPAGVDWYGFTLSFKGVFLEGLEVVFIVVTFGAALQSLALAAAGAGVAFLIVVGAGFLLHRPLREVPENTMKFAVGLLLSTFGTFWVAEGAGAEWPGSDAALLWVLAWLALASIGFTSLLRQRRTRRSLPAAVQRGES